MRRALLIGINNYPGDLRLGGCIEDINSLKNAIERHGNGEKNFGVKLMKDVQTSKEIMDGVKELFHDDADVALFYFSGHGYVNTTGAELVTPNDISNIIVIFEMSNVSFFTLGINIALTILVSSFNSAKNKAGTITLFIIKEKL